MKFLQDVTIIDFSQFLSGPSASLVLADLGARVIKIEKPGIGDICRELYVSDVVIDGESSIFQAINRNKESYTADLKDPGDVVKINKLIQQADVVIHNFRPGVMERLGFDYDQVKKINPSIVYASISGFGLEGPWKYLPGQDLLLQSMTGMTWLNNSADADPTPMGVSIVDILSGAHLAQGILSLLFQRGITGEGGSIHVSMIDTALDFQFEVLACYYNDGNKLPQRSNINSGHAYVGAPYGIYKTSDAFIALAMTDIVVLGKLLGSDVLQTYTNPGDWFTKRDEIKEMLVQILVEKPTSYWLSLLEPAGIWCSEVLDYQELREHEAYQALDMEMTVTNSNGVAVTTTRCPFKIDGQLFTSKKGAPLLGEHVKQINEEFNLNQRFKQDALLS